VAVVVALFIWLELDPMYLSLITAPPVAAQVYQVSQGFSWGDLLKLLAPPRKSGGSRSAGVCLLSIDSASNASNPVASLNPTLIWQGNAKRVSLHRSGETTVLWEAAIARSSESGKPQQVRYNGIPLKPGESYEWQLDGVVGKTYGNFMVLKAEDRGALAAKLAPLKGSDEATLQQRLTVYGEKGLRSDGLTELWKVRNPSSELRQELATLPDKRCPYNDPAPVP
jgi:hypothetical protein